MPAKPSTTPKPHPPNWSLTGPNFTGPREDVVATISGMQSIPAEFAVAVVNAINGMDKSVRGIRLNLHYANDGREFHINGHCTALY